jgi:hypothetical protein
MGPQDSEPAQPQALPPRGGDPSTLAGADACAPAALGEPHDTLLHAVQGLLRDLPGLVSDRVTLLSLELRRAGLAFAQIVALVVAAAILGVTAWLAMWVAIAGAVVALGVHWGLVALGVLLVNLAAMLVVALRARSLAHLLTLPATLRRLTVPDAHESATDRPQANNHEQQPTQPQPGA